jgi:hypothetical protein
MKITIYVVAEEKRKPRLRLIFASSFYGRENCQQWKLQLLTIFASIKKNDAKINRNLGFMQIVAVRQKEVTTMVN